MAVKTFAEIRALISILLADNTTQAINPGAHRNVVNAIVDKLEAELGGDVASPWPADTLLTEPKGLLPAGYNVGGLTVKEVEALAFMGFVAPTFASFAISGATTVKVGATISGSREFSFTFSNAGNVEANSLSILDVSDDSVLAEDEPITSPFTVDIGNVTNNTAATQQYRALVTDTEANVIQSPLVTISWQFSRYFGYSATNNPNDATLLAGGNELSGNANKTITQAPSGNQYFYFAYPASYGALSGINVNGFSALAAFTSTTRDVVNAQGVTVSCRVYVSNNLINASTQFQFIA